MGPHIRQMKAFKTGLLILLTAPLTQAGTPIANHQVLVIHSYHSGLSWTDSIMNGIRDTFARGGCDIPMSAEYLDARRYPDPEHARRIRELVVSKLEGTTPDLVLVSDNAALEFVLERRDRLFPDTPIVFCGINSFAPSMISNRRGITGVAEDMSIVETVDLVLQLHNPTKEVIVIGRTSVAADKANRDSFVAALPRLPSQLKVTFWDDLPLSQLKARLEKLESGSVVFLNGLIQDETGRQLMYGETTRWICRYSGVPVYSLWDVYLGYGIVGGKLIGGYRQGQMAAELALRILNGESADRLPVISARDANQYMFDHEQLLRFHISSSKLPKDAVVVNCPESFYHKYRNIVWTTIAVVFVLSASVVVLSIAVVHLRRAEETLRQANLVVENSPVMLFRWKAAEGWPVVLVSENVTQIGYTAEELLNGSVPFASIIHPDDLERVGREVQAYSTRGVERFQQEYRIIAKDGGVRWLDDRTLVERDSEGRVTHYQGMVVDITERKGAEEKLRESEQRFSVFMAHLPAAVFIKDAQGRVLFANRYLQELFGWRDCVGKLTEELLPPEIAEQMTADDRQVMAKGPKVLYEKVKDVNGHERIFETHKFPVAVAGNPALLGAIAVDITEHRKAEEALRKKTEELDRYFSSSLDLLCIADTAGHFIRLNPEWEKVLGFPLSELEGRSFLDLVHPDDRESTIQAVASLSAQKEVLRFVNRYRCKDGTYRWLEWNSYPAGDLIYAVARDITERKRTEDALRASQRRLADVIDFLPDATLAIDLGGNVVVWNRAMEEMTGVKGKDMIGKGDYEYAIPFYGDRWPVLVDFVLDPRPEIEKRRYSEYKRQGDTLIAEGAVPRLRGRETYLWGVAKPLYDVEGKVVGAIESLRDITERRRAEEALRKNEAMFGSLLAATPAGVALLINREFLQVNKALCRITGYSEEEMVGMATRILYPNDEEFDRVDREAYPQIEREGLATLEACLKRKDGTIINVLLCLAPFDPKDIKAGVTATVLDITERKRAEVTLERTRLLLEAVLDQSPVPMVVVSAPDLVVRYANRVATDFLGVSNEPSYIGLILSEVQKRQTWRDVRPDGTPMDLLAMPLARALRGETTRNEEYGIIRKDGTLRWELVNGTPVYNRAGELVAGLIVFPDITERKRAEEALQKLSKMQSVILDNSTVGIAFVRNRLFEWVNPRLPELYGIPMEQLQGASTRIVYPDDETYKRLDDKVFPILAQGKKVELEVEMRRRDGSSLWCRLEGNALDASKPHDGSIWIWEDITERKRAEEALAQHRDRLEELVRERTAELEKEIAERKQAEERIQTALMEKEVLLREVHHRVKNNLNTIANMLYFQTKTVEDKKALAAFQDSQNRIQSMARVHEHLYRSASLAQVNMAAYFEDLTTDLQQTCGTCPVSIQIDAANEHLDIDQAIPCGLIVNELVTNSLKYAFQGRTTNQRNEVTVQLTTQAEQHVLEVRDNGVGLPAGMDVENSSSLGLRLVSMLTRQLKARLTVDTVPGKGTKFRVTFSLEGKEKS
jgi:PAS domain S-box-containing protein